MESLLSTFRKAVPEIECATDPGFDGRCRDSGGRRGVAPLAVLRPRATEEVQRVVRAARQTGLKLVPVSSSGEPARGDTLVGPDTALVDMRHFDRIVRIDRRNRVALFEAGVGFPELTRQLHAHGLRPLLPLAPRSGKSALAAYLEREPTLYPRFQWDLSDPLLCIEVVFGTGELFRTGASAGPGTLEEQWDAGDAQTNPMGPGQSDLMRVVQGAQGTIGIVTWASVKCAPLPARETLHVVGAHSLAPLIRLAYGILRRGHADILFLVDGAAIAGLLARDRDEFRRALPTAPTWHLVYSLADARYFAEDKRRYVREEIRDLCRRHGLTESADLPAASLDELTQRLTRPDLDVSRPDWRRAGLTGAREIGFLTTLDRTERFLPVVDCAAGTAGLRPGDWLTYVQPLVGGRMCHMEVDFPFDLADELAARRVAAVTDALIHELRRAGAFFSRPYAELAEVAFRGHSSAWLIPKVKRIFDPDGILSPGCLAVPPAAAARGGHHAEQ